MRDPVEIGRSPEIRYATHFGGDIGGNLGVLTTIGSWLGTTA